MTVGDYGEFLAVSREILLHRPAGAAEELGLDEALTTPGSPEAEIAGYAFLEAQGFTGATSSTLSRIALADPALDNATGDLAHLPLAWPLDATPSSGWIAFGSTTDRALVDLPERGLVALPCSVAPNGRMGLVEDDYAHLVVINPAGGDVLVPEATMRLLRPAMLARVRLGAAAEILGAADRMLEDALRYTQTRIQFGRPIATFPAIRDLLAWGATERHQLREFLAYCWSLQPLSSPDENLSEIAKALAGTCGLKIAQATMQATGAMAFTAEYGHGALHRRILALDAAAGSCATLNREIGARARSTGEIPSYFSLDQLAASLS
jgi:hypothetical protein